jgi:hypothetical protein
MSGALSFDVDLGQLYALGDELRASDQQVYQAFARALRRTVTTLRTLAARCLRDELQLRTLNLLRRRLKTTMRANTGRYAAGEVWVGVNDMPASWFKGRPRQTGGGADMRGQHFAGAFVAKSKFKGRRTVFKRDGKNRLHIAEQNLTVQQQAEQLVEDKVFQQANTIFWQHFRRDLKARVAYNIGGT